MRATALVTGVAGGIGSATVARRGPTRGDLARADRAAGVPAVRVRPCRSRRSAYDAWLTDPTRSLPDLVTKQMTLLREHLALPSG